MGRRVTLMGIHEERDEGDGEMMVRAMGSIWEAYGKHRGSIGEARAEIRHRREAAHDLEPRPRRVSKPMHEARHLLYDCTRSTNWRAERCNANGHHGQPAHHAHEQPNVGPA